VPSDELSLGWERRGRELLYAKKKVAKSKSKLKVKMLVYIMDACRPASYGNA
jgi:hypothetical protein